MYIAVEDLERCVAQCVAHGGSVVTGPRAVGEARFCVVRDPAGAVCGLYQATPSA